ncbi:flagellar motor protein MotA [Segnochrobactraceae bacterium EtOH-i3]
MARATDPYRLSSPQIFLWRMVIFLVIVGFIVAILYRTLAVAFASNPGLNGLIIGVAVVGILLAFRQVIRLFREVKWVNSWRAARESVVVARPPVLLAPMAALLGDHAGATAISPQAMRTIMDSIATRLDEARDISRYFTGLLVFLGLLGTFWGLSQTVSSVGATIQSLDVSGGDATVIFEDLKSGLAAPLQGMGTAFASSLFGLCGSLVLGFLDLQAGQAQNRFYTDLEDWLSSVTDISPEALGTGHGATAHDVHAAIDRLARLLQDGPNGRQATIAMANLAEGISGLVQHQRAEQHMLRELVDATNQQQARVEALLARLTRALEKAE